MSYTNKAITDHTSPMLCTPITLWQRWNGPVCCWITLFAASALQCIVNGDIHRKPCFLSLVTLTLTFKLIQARDQTSLPCEFGTNSFSSARHISYTNKQKSHRLPNTEPYAVQSMWKNLKIKRTQNLKRIIHSWFWNDVMCKITLRKNMYMPIKHLPIMFLYLNNWNFWLRTQK